MTWNAAAERMYGYGATEIVGRSIYDLVPTDLRSEEQSILERVGRGEHVAHYETRRCRKDGTQLDISLTLSPIRDENGGIAGASSIQRDISDRRRAEDALRQAAKMEAIGLLAGGLAHDFNNQLYAVSGFAHFIGRDPGLSPATRQDLIELQKVAERMASLTRQLLAFARQQVLSPEVLDLNVAVDETLPMLRRLLGSNTAVELSLSPGAKWVRVDRAQLVQVLLNLVINARDAMPEGGTIEVRTTTHEVRSGRVFDRLKMRVEAGAYAELSVGDTGSGIAPEHLPHIFEPFYTTKEVGMGTGLGLATVEGIVAQSGGYIQVDSELGRGTRIKILLPFAPEPTMKPRSGPPGRGQEQVSRPNTGGGRRGSGAGCGATDFAGSRLRRARRLERQGGAERAGGDRWSGKCRAERRRHAGDERTSAGRGAEPAVSPDPDRMDVGTQQGSGAAEGPGHCRRAVPAQAGTSRSFAGHASQSHEASHRDQELTGKGEWAGERSGRCCLVGHIPLMWSWTEPRTRRKSLRFRRYRSRCATSIFTWTRASSSRSNPSAVSSSQPPQSIPRTSTTRAPSFSPSTRPESG